MFSILLYCYTTVSLLDFTFSLYSVVVFIDTELKINYLWPENDLIFYRCDEGKVEEQKCSNSNRFGETLPTTWQEWKWILRESRVQTGSENLPLRYVRKSKLLSYQNVFVTIMQIMRILLLHYNAFALIASVTVACKCVISGELSSILH